MKIDISCRRSVIACFLGIVVGLVWFDGLLFASAVVVKPPTSMFGARVHQLRAFVFRSKAWSEIDLQIDEVNSRGDYVLEDGEPYTRGTDDGLIDEWDDIVLRNKDFGDELLKKDLDLFSTDVREFWILDLRTQGKIFSVLITQDQVPATLNFSSLKTPKVDADFDEKSGRVESSLYQYDFQKKHPMLLGALKIRDGKNPQILHNVFQDAKFYMPLRTVWWLPNYSVTVDELQSQIECWRTGVIRSIIAVGVRYRKFLGLIDTHLFSELVFYKDSFSIPTMIEFVFDPSTYLRTGSGLLMGLQFDPQRPWVIDQTNLPSVTDPNTQMSDSKFYVEGSDQGKSMFFYLQMQADSEAFEGGSRPLLIRKQDFKSQALLKSSPWLASIQADLGIFTDVSKAVKGSYRFGLDLVVGYEPKALREVVDSKQNVSWRSPMQGTRKNPTPL